MQETLELTWGGNTAHKIKFELKKFLFENFIFFRCIH